MPSKLECLLNALKILRSVDREMPAQTAAVYLAIAAQPGLTSAAIARRVRIASSSVTRNVRKLLTHNLVTVQPKLDCVRPPPFQEKHVYLSEAGKRLLSALLAAMEGNGPESQNV